MTVLFTPASILELLSKIDELNQYSIGITETIDGKLQLQVGESSYEIEVEDVEEIPVDEYIIDEVEEINEDAYDDLIEHEDFEGTDQYEDIEAGLIKEAIKSMLLGGAIKLIKKLA